MFYLSYFIIFHLKNLMPPLPPPNLAIDHQVSIELMYASILGIQPVSLRCVSRQAGAVN